jgi:hypothetical protein
MQESIDIMISVTMAFLTRAASYVSRKGADSQTERTQVGIFVKSYLINSIVILSVVKNLFLYLVFVREVPRFSRDETPHSVFTRGGLLVSLGQRSWE